jgi:hypothetical protein
MSLSPLIKKLGIKPGMRTLIVAAPGPIPQKHVVENRSDGLLRLPASTP